MSLIWSDASKKKKKEAVGFFAELARADKSWASGDIGVPAKLMACYAGARVLGNGVALLSDVAVKNIIRSDALPGGTLMRVDANGQMQATAKLKSLLELAQAKLDALEPSNPKSKWWPF